jgi:hypothetical protein
MVAAVKFWPVTVLVSVWTREFKIYDLSKDGARRNPINEDTFYFA